MYHNVSWRAKHAHVPAETSSGHVAINESPDRWHELPRLDLYVGSARLASVVAMAINGQNPVEERDKEWRRAIASPGVTELGAEIFGPRGPEEVEEWNRASEEYAIEMRDAKWRRVIRQAFTRYVVALDSRYFGQVLKVYLTDGQGFSMSIEDARRFPNERNAIAAAVDSPWPVLDPLGPPYLETVTAPEAEEIINQVED